jgi:hypothetical protein
LSRAIDIARAAQLRAEGQTWPRIADMMGTPVSTLRDAVKRYNFQKGLDNLNVPATVSETATEEREKSLLARLPVKVTNLDELIAALQVDMEEWKVKGFTGNAWQGQTAEGVETFLQVKAQFERDRARELEAIRLAGEEIVELMKTHAPPYEALDWMVRDGVGSMMGHKDPCLYSIHIYDPHLGMLAWGEEVGESYDIRIARSTYATAADHLCSLGAIYPVERVMVVIGNDMGHVDTPGINRRGGTTTAGTPQDVDGRVAKQFTTMLRCAVHLIDRARLLAPVDVMMVGGNHDRETVFKLGVVLAAWYRNDPEVTVHNSPAKRSFYAYGRNAFMLTHGEEYRRQRSNLPLIMATECPAQMWVDSVYREILTGHNHAKLEGRYWPTSDMDEERAIRTRSLPGLTASDAWHVEEGYKHTRSATAIAYRRSGGVAGLHEFNLFNEKEN